MRPLPKIGTCVVVVDDGRRAFEMFTHRIEERLDNEPECFRVIGSRRPEIVPSLARHRFTIDGVVSGKPLSEVGLLRRITAALAVLCGRWSPAGLILRLKTERGNAWHEFELGARRELDLRRELERARRSAPRSKARARRSARKGR